MFASILKFKRKAILRELSEEWVTYFILAPVMIGVVFLLGRRVFADFAVDIGRINPVSLPQEITVRLAFFLLFLKVFFNFLPMTKRLFPTERSLSVEDLLPIDYNIRYYVFYIEQLFRDLPFFIFAVFLVFFFGRPDLIGWPITMWFLFPGVEIGFTLFWIHFRSPERKELAGLFLVILFLLLIMPIAQFSWWFDAFTLIFAATGFQFGFRVWRYRDMGRVEQFLVQHENREGKGRGADVLQALCRIVPKNIRSLVRRDLILTARNFVPHFWRNLVLALLVSFSVAGRGAVALAPFCTVAVFIMASTVSPLFALQRPFRPADGVLPISAEQVWRAKLYYARLLALPIPFIIWGVEMLVRPVPLMESLTLLFTLFLLGIAVASLVGGSICEGDQRPALQYIVAALLSALATLFIAIFNPAMFLVLFPILSHLKESAITRLEHEEA